MKACGERAHTHTNFAHALKSHAHIHLHVHAHDPPAITTSQSCADIAACVGLLCPKFPLAPVFHFATKMFPSHSQLTMLSRIAHNTLANEKFCTFLQPVTTCDFKPNLARIVLAAQTQDAVGGCEVRGRKHVKRLRKKGETVNPYSRNTVPVSQTRTCFHVVVALPGCVSMVSLPAFTRNQKQMQFTSPV